MDWIAELLRRLVAEGRYPTRAQEAVIARVRAWRQYLESDRDAIADRVAFAKDRDYKLDPVGELIADAWADHILGEGFVVTPATARDAGALTLMLEQTNDLPESLHTAARDVVGEGERWWRVYVDRDVADAPLVEWHGRDEVIPLEVAGKLKAVALVTELPRPHGDKGKRVYRHLEVHADQVVEHVLMVGTPKRLGQSAPLDSHPDLVDLANALASTAGGETELGQRWEHGLPILMGCITNGPRRDRRLNVGISDFHRIEDALLALNEAATLGDENMRLTAKSKVVVSEDSLQPGAPVLVDNGDGTMRQIPGTPAPTFDAGEGVIVHRPSNEALDGTTGGDPYKILEHTFDAAALIAYGRHRLEQAVTRVGLTPQSVGVITGNEGIAVSGTALRLRLIPEVRTGRGKGRQWDRGAPVLLTRMQELDALAEEAGGFGREWATAATAPTFTRGYSLPSDPVEDAAVERDLVGAGVRSLETSVRAQHPTWGDVEVKAEVQRIRAERPAPSSAFGALG